MGPDEVVGSLRDALEAGQRVLRRALGAAPLTSFGWAALAVALISWALAARFGWLELALVAATMIVLLVTGLVFLLRRSALEVRLDVTPERVSVGTAMIGAVLATNGGSTRSFPQRVELPVGDGIVTFDVPSLAAKATFEQAFAIPTDRRQVIQVGPVTVVRGDPLGLYQRSQSTAPAVTVWVHPRTSRLRSHSQGWAQDIDAPTSDTNPQGDVAFHTIREYVAGDDLRHIHWRSTARMERFMVRHYVDNRRPKFALAIDVHRGSYATQQEFETVMEAAASIERRSFELGCPIVHHLGRRRVADPRIAGLLDTLSEVNPSGRGDLGDAVKGVLGHDTDASVAILITGSAAGSQVAQRHGQRLSRRMRTATVVVTPERSGLSLRGGSTHLAVQSLEDFASRWQAAGVQ